MPVTLAKRLFGVIVVNVATEEEKQSFKRCYSKEFKQACCKYNGGFLSSFISKFVEVCRSLSKFYVYR